MEKSLNEFIQSNSPDGGFLQSDEWREFQERTGQKTFLVEQAGFRASIVEHNLPIAGKYFYVPRGPIVEIPNSKLQITNFFSEIISLAKENNIGWVRMEPAENTILEEIKKGISYKIVKAPHDMQPKEILALDITKSEEQLLSEMGEKTRYNIRLAEKKGVAIIGTEDKEEMMGNKYIEEFLRLTKIMAERNKISSHSAGYYQKMIETLPKENIKIYSAKYNDQIIAANLVIFFGKFATYLHGASDNVYRNVMAPYLLHWRIIQDAKKNGLERYDLGGVKSLSAQKEWAGITRFKMGFSRKINPIAFPGAYDIIISKRRYYLYRMLQFGKSVIKHKK